jgi:tRNA nucleotidyltransferase (CCA-adding enzyme)
LINLFKDLKVQICPKEALEDILTNWKYGLNRLYGNDKEIVFKIIPELEKEDGFDQKNDYHIYDVWEHTLKALEKSDNDLEIRLAVLLHDIGKLHSYQEDGEIRHFKGHAQKSAEMAKEMPRRIQR